MNGRSGPGRRLPDPSSRSRRNDRASRPSPSRRVGGRPRGGRSKGRSRSHRSGGRLGPRGAVRSPGGSAPLEVRRKRSASRGGGPPLARDRGARGRSSRLGAPRSTSRRTPRSNVRARDGRGGPSLYGRGVGRSAGGRPGPGRRAGGRWSARASSRRRPPGAGGREDGRGRSPRGGPESRAGLGPRASGLAGRRGGRLASPAIHGRAGRDGRPPSDPRDEGRPRSAGDSLGARGGGRRPGVRSSPRQVPPLLGRPGRLGAPLRGGRGSAERGRSSSLGRRGADGGRRPVPLGRGRSPSRGVPRFGI